MGEVDIDFHTAHGRTVAAAQATGQRAPGVANPEPARAAAEQAESERIAAEKETLAPRRRPGS